MKEQRKMEEGMKEQRKMEPGDTMWGMKEWHSFRQDFSPNWETGRSLVDLIKNLK